MSVTLWLWGKSHRHRKSEGLEVGVPIESGRIWGIVVYLALRLNVLDVFRWFSMPVWCWIVPETMRPIHGRRCNQMLSNIELVEDTRPTRVGPRHPDIVWRNRNVRVRMCKKKGISWAVWPNQNWAIRIRPKTLWSVLRRIHGTRWTNQNATGPTDGIIMTIAQGQ